MENKIEMSFDYFRKYIELEINHERLSDELNELISLIFDNVELNYDNELRLRNTDKILDYLKIKETKMYKEKQKELKMKKEEEN